MSEKRTGTFSDWVELLRLFGLPCSILPAFLGAAFAHSYGHFRLFPFLYLLAGVVLVHVVSNVTNEYYDVKAEIDTADQEKPSTVLAEGRIDPELALKFSHTLLLIAVVALIIYALVQQLPGLILIAAIGMAGGYFYTAPPLKLKYRGLGVPANFIFLGLLVPQGIFYGLSGELYLLPGLGLSLPMSILTVAMLWSNDMRDIRADEEIITLVGILGLKISYIIYLIILFSPYLLAVYYYMNGQLSILIAAQILILPFVVKLARIGLEGARGELSKLAHLDQKTSFYMIAFNIIWVLAYFTS